MSAAKGPIGREIATLRERIKDQQKRIKQLQQIPDDTYPVGTIASAVTKRGPYWEPMTVDHLWVFIKTKDDGYRDWEGHRVLLGGSCAIKWEELVTTIEPGSLLPLAPVGEALA
jgi:hypothetical protein